LAVTAAGEIILAGASGQANLPFTQFVLVHELGHVFDNRSPLANCGPTLSASSCRLLNLAFQGLASGVCPEYLRDAIRLDTSFPSFPGSVFPSTCVEVIDDQGWRVLGPLGSAYARRDRGWGSGPDNLFTEYQQHPATVFSADLPALILEEEAADMFLNWVYRTLSDFPFTYLASVPGTWNGYRNQSWGTIGPNQYEGDDAFYPGDARVEWMHIVMRNIFDEKGW